MICKFGILYAHNVEKSLNTIFIWPLSLKHMTNSKWYIPHTYGILCLDRDRRFREKERKTRGNRKIGLT